MASERGLTAAIVNPSAVRTGLPFSEEEQLGADFLTGKDHNAVRYIARLGGDAQTAAAPAAGTAQEACGHLEKIYNLVVEGNSDEIVPAVESALEAFSPEEIMNSGLIKALEKVGDYYSAGVYFLPQMIASAEAMKAGFARLKPLLAKDGVQKKGKAVICTVRGDVHDIGKNIVAMMLENHGFEVIDLGKDVPSEDVIAAVKEYCPDILCLSSLLTTTMNEMKIISEMVKEQSLPVRLVVGGAVVNREYAESIGALYGKDAVEGVKAATRIMEEK
jgi:5-methyltetrahydrofolate--homocysteine methyltransferase